MQKKDDSTRQSNMHIHCWLHCLDQAWRNRGACHEGVDQFPITWPQKGARHSEVTSDAAVVDVAW
jgi:hypothetical protein